MNDPGLDAPIAEDGQVLDRADGDEDETQEEQQEFLESSMWWFASTAFPLVAGTFGPMASAFSICALVVRWRQVEPNGDVGADAPYVNDPKWLTGINAAQLALALISNLALLLNMARRLRFSIAQPITIVGWYISSFTLIALICTSTGPLKLDGVDYGFSQAFYYAIFAAGLYFLVASLMVVTVVGAYRGHYDKDFKLTMSQRTLMLQTISFLVYLLVGSVIYSHIEGWDFLDAVYWSDFTLLTIGIGDLAPQTSLGRGLLFPYAIGGVIILGLVIGSIRSLVLERGKVKLGARMIEKERERCVKKAERKHTGILDPIVDEKGRSITFKGVTVTSERERRELEFYLMRGIQDHAARKRRWTALCVSASTWFVLWFAGAAIFMASEDRPQDWDYLTALYFAYTSLLTIGYGDAYPESDAGRAFFVFWSLLAIPSLTILISNMGDTIVKEIRDLTLWVGNLTVLPGEEGIRDGFKAAIKKITEKTPFGGYLTTKPPGLLGEADKRRPSEDSAEGNNYRKNDPESAAQRVAGDRADKEASNAQKEGEKNDQRARPKSKRHYHVMLIKEIGKVSKHLNSNPPRKYTFDEWAWYLRLIGEDEGDTETHRKAPIKPNEDDAEFQGAGMQSAASIEDDASNSEAKVKWSWVSYRSPLMGSKEEAEWVLERLTQTLHAELQAMRKDEIESGKDVDDDGDEESDNIQV